MPMIKIQPAGEIPQNTRMVVAVGKYKVLVIHAQGKFYAVENRCPHMKLPLSKGKVTDDHAIVCPFHHSAFDLENGDVKAWSPWPPVVGKAFAALAREKALTVFETEVKDGDLWISSEPRA